MLCAKTTKFLGIKTTKLHSRAESLSLESLDMSRAVDRESLDIPKFGRISLDMGRESLDIPKFVRESLDMGRESLDLLKFGCESLEMATLGRESLDIPNMSRDVLVAPSPLWSR